MVRGGEMWIKGDDAAWEICIDLIVSCKWLFVVYTIGLCGCGMLITQYYVLHPMSDFTGHAQISLNTTKSPKHYM